MANNTYFTKDPTDNLDYQVDWFDWLALGETISTSTFVVPAGLTVGVASNTSSSATQWLSGGTAGQTYTILNRIVTSAGRTAERTFTLSVVSSTYLPPWTYDPAAMLSTAVGTFPDSTVGLRNQIRFVIQDNNVNRQLLADAEIDWIQTQEMNQYMMAAACCDVLVARAGNIKTKKISEFSITYDSTFYRQLATTMRARGMSYQLPYAGGISRADKLAQQMDADWVSPLIMRGLDNNPQAPSPATPPVQFSPFGGG